MSGCWKRASAKLHFVFRRSHKAGMQGKLRQNGLHVHVLQEQLHGQACARTWSDFSHSEWGLVVKRELKCGRGSLQGCRRTIAG